ncbi:monovalent cation/H+ antiporter subunit D family protein [Corynebacterium sp. ES2775-CONJ]|uniref:monovalent cation/H+ antiporter subunit D family protein n=1 Tax=Corynebacterium sp. ES2775-CONJ TaxID=2974029 RepID=UPI00216A84BF|nr:monovalent cation/H+ antiporter subunit D family protein [Corynebacterium sp. ES2775-CONJ]MCS4490338.1 monovalent cation/H+ antiporter subunit D family protein [Corynebacterium sp. ES2775-CONJ]
MEYAYTLPLFVGIPLLFVGLAAVIPWRLVRDALMLIVPVGTGLAGLWLYALTASHGVIAHSVGLYIGGVAIPFVGDQFSALMIVTTSIVAFVANWFSIVVGETRARFFNALSLMLLTGVMGALLTADLFNFFVFIEVMLLPSYGLLAMTGTWARLSAGRTFVLVNLATSTILLAGVAVVYGVVGTVNIAALRGVAAGHGPATVAMGIVVIALVVKAGIFPVHTWLPRTYPATSAGVMALFSGLHTKVAVYALFRIYTVIFDLDQRWATLIIVVAVASMVVGSFSGLAENTMRRVLSYQMVNGMPFILVTLAFSAGQARIALAAGILYMVHHMITLGSLILTAGAIEETYGNNSLRKLSGIMHRDPLVAAVFAAGAFSVVGFPPFSGVWGKLYIMIAVAQAGSVAAWIVLAVMVIASFAAFLAMLRVWRKVFWGGVMNKSRIPSTLRVPFRRIAPAMSMMVISLAMFIFAGPLVGAIHDAAAQLLDTEAYAQAVLISDKGAPVAVASDSFVQAGR